MGLTISSIKNNPSSNLFEAEKTGIDQNLQSSQSTPAVTIPQLHKNIIENIFKDASQRDFVAISQVNKQCRHLAHLFIKQIKCNQSTISKKKLCEGLKGWNIQNFKGMRSIHTLLLT